MTKVHWKGVGYLIVVCLPMSGAQEVILCGTQTTLLLIASCYFMCNRKIQMRYQIGEGHKTFIKSVK